MWVVVADSVRSWCTGINGTLSALCGVASNRCGSLPDNLGEVKNISAGVWVVKIVAGSVVWLLSVVPLLSDTESSSRSNINTSPWELTILDDVLSVTTSTLSPVFLLARIAGVGKIVTYIS